jgi:hypothetical protein
MAMRSGAPGDDTEIRFCWNCASVVYSAEKYCASCSAPVHQLSFISPIRRALRTAVSVVRPSRS